MLLRIRTSLPGALETLFWKNRKIHFRIRCSYMQVATACAVFLFSSQHLAYEYISTLAYKSLSVALNIANHY